MSCGHTNLCVQVLCSASVEVFRQLSTSISDKERHRSSEIERANFSNSLFFFFSFLEIRIFILTKTIERALGFSFFSPSLASFICCVAISLFIPYIRTRSSYYDHLFAACLSPFSSVFPALTIIKKTFK